MVENEKIYWEFIRKLRNLNVGFLEQVKITSNQQHDYMTINGNNYYICLEGDNVTGFIGLVDNDIRLSVSPDHRNKGIAEFMLKWLIEKFPDAKAQVLYDNLPSKKLFEKCGFKPHMIMYKKENK